MAKKGMGSGQPGAEQCFRRLC